MRGGSLLFFFFFLLLFYFLPSPPIRSGEVFSSVIFFFLSFSSFVCVFLDVAMVWKGKPASVTTGSRDRTYYVEIIIIIINKIRLHGRRGKGVAESFSR